MTYLIPLDPKKYFTEVSSNNSNTFYIKDEIIEWSKRNGCEINVIIVTPELKIVFTKSIYKFSCDSYDDEDIEDCVFIEITDIKQYSMFKLRWEV